MSPGASKDVPAATVQVDFGSKTTLGVGRGLEEDARHAVEHIAGLQSGDHGAVQGGDHNSLRWTHPEVEQLVVEFFRGQLGK